MAKAERTAKLSSQGNWMRGVRHITGRGKAQHTDLTWECAYCVQGSAKRMNSWSGEYEGEMGEGVRVTGNRIVGTISITKNLAYVTHRALEIFKPG